MIILAEYTSFPGEKALQKLDLPINKFIAQKVVQRNNGQYQIEHCQGDTCLLKIKTSSPLNPMFSLHTPQVGRGSCVDHVWHPGAPRPLD